MAGARLRALARQGGCPRTALCHHLRDHELRRGPLRPQPGPHPRARVRLHLCGKRDRGRACGRPPHPLRVLGADGPRIDGGAARRGRRRSAPGGRTLLRRAHARRGVPDGRGAAPRLADRLPRVHRDGSGFVEHLAHARRGAGQRRRPAALRLARGRLSRGVVERHGVPLRVHHEGGGVRAHPGLPGDRGARVARALHDLLRHHLRPPRERHAPDPRLQHREPGGVHGRGGSGSAPRWP